MPLSGFHASGRGAETLLSTDTDDATGNVDTRSGGGEREEDDGEGSAIDLDYENNEMLGE